MAITNNTYFKNEIYIPHAKPSLTDDVTTVESAIQSFIEEYEAECLLKCFGYLLYEEFNSQLDESQANGLKVTADAKWDDLLNGKTYNNSDGDSVTWKGIRRKFPLTSTEFNKSFLAEYVYYAYESNDYITRSGTGHQKNKTKNSEMVPPTQKVTKAWNKFVKIVQGENIAPKLIIKPYGVGIDYFQGGQDINLYQFIRDMNDLVEDTYANFNPFTWKTKNQFGI